MPLWHSEDRASWYILIIKPTRCTNFSFFLNRSLHVSDRFSVHHQESGTVYTATGMDGSILIPLASSQQNLYDMYLLLCIQYWTPDDGQKTCPKHVEFKSKNKFGKLVHLVDFIIRIPSWSCSQAVSKPVWHIPLLCVEGKTPDDGQRNCSKHVEFNSKNKFVKLVHLVGFIIKKMHTLLN